MKYLNLSSGASYFPSPDFAVDRTIKALQKGETFYGETEGLPALRTAISEYYLTEYLANIPEENILITAGTKQALHNLFSVLLQPGDEVILPRPSWFGFPELLQQAGARVVYLDTVLEENFDLVPKKLEELISPKTRLFIFSNPNNPTGRIYSKPEISALLQCLDKYPQVRVLSDEIYDQVIYEPASVNSLLQFPDPHQNHMVVSGFSKSFAMSGWRIGFIVAPTRIYKISQQFQQATISGVNPFVQEGAVAMLANREQFLPGMLDVLSENRAYILNWLKEHPDIRFFPPQGTYYVFAELTNLLKKAFFKRRHIATTTEFCDFLKEKFNLELVPGERFDCPGFVRITFAVTKADLEKALERLAKLIEKSKREEINR
ncbi:MAG TPA: aminotransferase class I/II-fold pyridoxal phosphate-dependent enzyme [Adhaeribacter sp.]|nr:aminotransferase class I/II-fold pyridoxal phosphate-dependent enzyme [Adhaeribacter sp.]